MTRVSGQLREWRVAKSSVIKYKRHKKHESGNAEKCDCDVECGQWLSSNVKVPSEAFSWLRRVECRDYTEL